LKLAALKNTRTLIEVCDWLGYYISKVWIGYFYLCHLYNCRYISTHGPDLVIHYCTYMLEKTLLFFFSLANLFLMKAVVSLIWLINEVKLYINRQAQFIRKQS
jgi:hypothetical protein